MDMEQRKNQFFLLSLMLLMIGFLQYFRKITNGYKLSKIGKVLYLATMIIFVITIMIVLYFTELNSLVSFCLGLVVTTLSEHIAKMFMVIGNNFNNIVIKIVDKYIGIDLSEELKEEVKKPEVKKQSILDKINSFQNEKKK